MSSSYNRSTELRNVHPKDLYNLAVILDNDNYWQILMEVIPQVIDNQTFGTAADLEKISSGGSYERKYSNDDIQLIENSIRRPGESRLHSQILFDEWGSSGRKNERPTLGVLLHLLVQSKLYRAADFVAELLLEPKPPRPNNGPAAEFEFEVDVFNDIQETVNDSRFYPNTEDLQENITIEINKDYYTKYHRNGDKKMTTINDNNEGTKTTAAPKPPPRLVKSAKLLKQKQQMLKQQELNQLLQQTADRTKVNNRNGEEYSKQEEQLNTQSNNESTSTSLPSPSSNNLPKLSALMSNKTNIEATTKISISLNSSLADDDLLPKLSALNNSSESAYQAQEEDEISLNSTPSLIYTKPNISEDHEQQLPVLNSVPIIVLSKPLKREKLKLDNDIGVHNDLPVLSALNLNGERDDNLENVSSVALEFATHRSSGEYEYAVNDCDVPFVMNINYNQNSPGHQLEAIEEDYNGIEHEDENSEVELEDDEDSIPNLSFLENRSSNNESSLTSVTNTSGENSFEQSANDYSSTSADNIPVLSALNQ